MRLHTCTTMYLQSYTCWFDDHNDRGLVSPPTSVYPTQHSSLRSQPMKMYDIVYLCMLTARLPRLQRWRPSCTRWRRRTGGWSYPAASGPASQPRTRWLASRGGVVWSASRSCTGRYLSLTNTDHLGRVDRDPCFESCSSRMLDILPSSLSPVFNFLKFTTGLARLYIIHPHDLHTIQILAPGIYIELSFLLLFAQVLYVAFEYQSSD